MKYLLKNFFILILTLATVSSLSIPVNANGYNTFPPLKINESELQQAIEKELQKTLSEISNVTERKAIENGVRANLKTVNTSHLFRSKSINLGDIWTINIPDIHIHNKVVEATINIIIGAIVSASGAGSLVLAIKQYGQAQLKRIFISTFKKKVIGKAALTLGISLPFIANFICDVIDPAERIAAYLDSKDKQPNNGYLDVIW